MTYVLTKSSETKAIIECRSTPNKPGENPISLYTARRCQIHICKSTAIA